MQLFIENEWEIFLFVCLYRAAPMAYGGSQAKGLIGATATSQCHYHSHSNARSEPTPQLTATSDPYPLSETTDETHSLMVPSKIRFHCSMMGTLEKLFIFTVEWPPYCSIK